MFSRFHTIHEGVRRLDRRTDIALCMASRGNKMARSCVGKCSHGGVIFWNNNKVGGINKDSVKRDISPHHFLHFAVILCTVALELRSYIFYTKILLHASL